MYKAFYKLQKNPFEITPDPAFFYPTPRTNEALAALYYGVLHHKGFVVMSGEVGTGKTLLVRYLLQLLKQKNVGYAYIFNPRLSDLGFLQYIAGDFGLVLTGKSKSQLLLELGRLLVSRHQKNLTTVLVVDEAHHLSADVLEEIRLLTNIETTDRKLLQILLVGQPELDEKLDSIDLRQLKQRIALRCQLEPLDREEIVGYVERRLAVAGANTSSKKIFAEGAVAAIQRHSRGIPRLINTICENALILGYARQTETISAGMIDDVAKELRLGVVRVAKAHSVIDPSTELWHAVDTLLKIQHRLRSSEPDLSEPKLTLVSDTRNREPLI